MNASKHKGTTTRLVIFIIFILLGLLIILRLRINSEYRNDTIQVNRIHATVTDHWDNLEQGDYETFSYPFAVLDSAGQLLFSWNNPESVTIEDVMRYSDVSLPIQSIQSATGNIKAEQVSDGSLVGTLIIETHRFRVLQQQAAQQETTFLLLCLLAFALITLFIYDWYLHCNIIKPFYQIQEFTKKLSYGDFDAELNIEGNKAFLPFVQGLDVMREELRTAKQREFEANQSKKALVASLSHDIKTPVTSIKLAVELLEVKVTDAELLERLQAISAKTEQIDHLVSDLFHTTMEDMDALTITLKDIYSSELITLIQEADLNHSVNTLSIPDCLIKTDPIRIGQVFANIIYNSYKYAGTKIDITATIEPEYLAIAIQDYGQGVDSEELPCIFNRFYRGKNVGTQTGSGLGLYICKSLIDKMEGEIYCNNRENGFETLIKLPLV